MSEIEKENKQENVSPLTLLVAFLVVVGLLTIAWKYETKKYSEKYTTIPLTLKSPQNIKSQDVFSAADVTKIFVANSINAESRLNNTVFRVKGEVDSFENGLLGGIYVVLDGHSFLDGIKCSFISSQRKSVSTIEKGQIIVIEGTCSGRILDSGYVNMDECTLIDIIE